MFSTTLLLAFVAAPALANVYVTSPVATTSFTAGQTATISWQDDGNSPSLASFGASKVSIYAGNVQQQTMLQNIVPSVDVSTTSSIQFTPDGSIGPNSNEYFIRFESLTLKDTTNPQYPALAFSAKFTMAGMTGTFNSTVQGQIDGQSTAGAVGATTAASSASATSKVGATTTGSSSATKSASASGSSSRSGSAAAATSSSNDAPSTKSAQLWVGAFAGALVGAALF